MYDYIKLLLENQPIQWIFIGLVLLAAIMIVILFVQYNIDRAKGRHAKFLWFEVNATQPVDTQKTESFQQQTVVNGKNINTGANYGEIGDKYTGLKQRTVNEDDIKVLESEIKRFSKEYTGKINRSHLTLGYPGCKETTNLAYQIIPILNKMGFNKIQAMNLQTYGVVGKKFGVSNAPDNTLMVEIYPADNVE